MESNRVESRVRFTRLGRIACLATLAGWTVCLLAAGPRPGFSGVWTLSLSRSHLDARVGAGIEKGSVTVTQTDARFAFRRVFVTGGREDRSGYDLTLDGRETTVPEGPMTRRSKLAWDGDVLVLSERVVAPQGEATNTVRYRLLDGGKTLEARESFRGPKLQYDNVWVFERQSQ
jgi:hypothetical protein